MHQDGHCIYPASCVRIGDRAVLITGESGIGKSELALALIDRGAQLISDDQVALQREAGQLVASPAPNIGGLIEVRNLGLMPMPMPIEVSAQCAVALIIELNRTAPRWIERCPKRCILDIAIPEILLNPDSTILPIKAEMALQAYGLKG
jgi:serine kinase of HPr protein (carbohydrate metabolism regulator)